MGTRDDFIEREHALGETPRHPSYEAFDRALDRLSVPSSGPMAMRHRAFEIIRETLEDAGIPFLRANALAEKCHKALGEIL